MGNKTFLLGVGFNSLKIENVLELIIKGLGKTEEKYYVVTPNPEILVLADSNPSYKKVLNSAKLALPDGIGIMMTAKLLGKPLRERISGVDLMESLCKEVSKRPITVGFLGAGPNVAELTAECLREKYPGLKVVFTGQEWNFGGSAVGRQSRFSDDARRNLPQSSKTPRSLSESLSSESKDNQNGEVTAFGSPQSELPPAGKNHQSSIINHNIDILFVAFGSPKQEIWIAENLSRLPVKVAIGVGGAFDFVSGKVRRAPILMRKLGLEWLFRLIIQPWRIKRQLRLIKFIFLVCQVRLGL